MAKPEQTEDYCLKYVAEMRPNVYLLSVEAMNPNFRYVIYDERKPDQPLRPLKVVLSDNTFEIISLGNWLYVFELNGPLRIINKET